LRFLAKLGIAGIIIAICFLISVLLGFISIICGVIYLYVSEEGEDKKEPLYPATRWGSNMSSAWLGAKLDEDEARRKEAEKEPRDQGH